MSVDKDTIFTNFITTNKVLVVDKNSASRSRLRMSLINNGFPQDNIYATSDYNEAFEFIKEHQPQLVLSDYLIKNGSGFDLFKEYKGHYPQLKKIICILITSNISQSLVAKAAEEDVDSFIIKPYTAKGLKASIQNTILSKIKPTPYVKKIEEGKELLFAKDYTGASDIFNEAIKMVQEPSLALFYHGQAQYLLQLTNEAETDFKEGLQINKVHFKCQVGLYEILRDQKRHEEAYEVVRNLSKYFPANPERLAEVIRLCVITENYHDMLEYYKVFTTLDDRPQELKRHVAAGVYIAGKFQFINNQLDSSKIFFEKVGVSFSDCADVMEKIIYLMIDKKQFEFAEDMLKRYPVGIKESNYEILEFLVNNRNYQNFEKVQKGLTLFNSNKRNFDATFILLKALKEKGDDELFDKYFLEAKTLWPKMSMKFKKTA